VIDVWQSAQSQPACDCVVMSNLVCIASAGHHDANRVFVLIGSDLPTDLLAASGIRVQTHRGELAVRT